MEWEINCGTTLHLTKDLLSVIDIHFFLSYMIILIDILFIHKFAPTRFTCFIRNVTKEEFACIILDVFFIESISMGYTLYLCILSVIKLLVEKEESAFVYMFTIVNYKFIIKFVIKKTHITKLLKYQQNISFYFSNILRRT